MNNGTPEVPFFIVRSVEYRVVVGCVAVMNGRQVIPSRRESA